MAEAFIGEIRALPYTFVPYGWLACDGSQYTAQQYAALFTLLAGVFPGTQPNTFKVPDLRGFAGIGVGSNALGNYTLGHTVGQSTVTLTQAQLPNHDHGLQTQGGGARLTAPSSAALPFVPAYISPTNSKSYALPMYVAATTSPTTVPMSQTSVGVAGGMDAHNNLSPLLVLRFCINWDGYYPNFPD